MSRTGKRALRPSAAHASPGARRARGAAACVLVALLVAFALPSLRPEKVEAQNAGAETLELIPAGSLVIPMDNTLQAIGTPFNLKAYGAAVNLLWAGIPVKWVIQPGKVKDGIDFTATAQRIYPSNVGAASRSFSGGPFVVHRDFAAAAKNAIASFATTNNVAVYETTADVTVPVRHTMTHKPKVAVFDDGGSALIHTNYLVAAGFTSGTHYGVIPAATLVTVNASACFTIGSEPHWTESNGASDPQVSAIRQFVESGGNFLAECDGIITYENNTTYGRFQTTNGFVKGNARTGIQYPNPDLPYSQFVGALEDVGGSVRDFQPSAGGTYHASAEMHAQSPSGTLGGNASILPAKGTVSRLAGPSVGGFVFYLGGHEYATTSLGGINGIRMYLNAVMTPTSRPSSCGLALTPRTISGTVFEDVNGDSVLTDGVPRPNVPVRLYQDANANGVVDTGDTFLVATNTDASGQYSFEVTTESTGSNYLVAVDSKSVTPSAGLIAGRGDAWAEQTYGDNPSTDAFDPGSRFGGVAAGTSDNYNAANTAPGSNAYQHLARVSVASASVTNAHFGFSFNVVTNTRAGDTADDDTASAGRTVQGSLRQFIQNANAVTGANYSRFVPAVAANSGSLWRVTVTSTLPAIIDADTTIDGRAYSSTNGTTINDSNPGSLGAGGAVGTDNVALPQVERPELEILDGGTIAIGLDLQANDVTIRRVSIFGFGNTPNNDSHANVRIGNNFTGALIEESVIGASATSFTEPASAQRTGGDNVRSVGGDNGTLRRNLIGFAAGKGFGVESASNNWMIELNEVRGNGIGNPNLDGIDFENNSNSNTARYNLVTANEGVGVDSYLSGGSNVILNNTISGNGVGAGAGVETAGVRLYGTGNTVERNVMSANYGAGVMVTSSSSSNRITRNSIFANGTINNKGGGAASGQIGIDLLAAADNQLTGTSPYVTINDAGDADTGGNGLLNFPVLTEARIISGNLVLKGYARAGSEIEFFVAAPDPTGFGEGQTYVLTLTEGSGSDADTATGTYVSPVNGLNVGTDNTSLFSFTVPVPAGVAVGSVLTSTATLSSSTSEFSNNVVVQNAPPAIELEKRCTSPANCESAVQPPGTELTYTITFTNTGGSAASSFSIVDVVPFSEDAATATVTRSTDFKVGSMTFSPGTTALTLPAGGMQHFSDPINYPPPTPPWNPSTSYTPPGAPGTFDPNVTFVKWQFSGTMAPGTSGSVSFTVRIR